MRGWRGRGCDCEWMCILRKSCITMRAVVTPRITVVPFLSLIDRCWYEHGPALYTMTCVCVCEGNCHSSLRCKGFFHIKQAVYLTFTRNLTKWPIHEARQWRLTTDERWDLLFSPKQDQVVLGMWDPCIVPRWTGWSLTKVTTVMRMTRVTKVMRVTGGEQGNQGDEGDQGDQGDQGYWGWPG